MKLDVDFDTLLEVALGGPEIGPLNLYVLHGLMRQLFDKLGMSQKPLVIDEDDAHFADGYNFIKSKLDEKKKKQKMNAGIGKSRERSRVSVIVSDYVRTPIGKLPESIPEDLAGVKPSKLQPADFEDRLRYVETQLKTVEDFPSADQLRSWAQEKKNPDTVVTDLWHFVSLNSRMNGAEEGMQKLTELVDRLIPELKRLSDEKERLQGLIDDLYSQMKGLSDRATRIDDRLDQSGKAELQNLSDLKDQIKNVEDQFSGYAKLIDLEDFLLAETFVSEKNLAREVANKMQEDIDSKMALSMLESLKDRGHEEIKKLQDEISEIQNSINGLASKDDMPELSSYVQWPQLEDALLHQPSPPSSRASSKQSSRVSSRQDLHTAFPQPKNKSFKGDIASRENGLVQSVEEKEASFEGYNHDSRTNGVAGSPSESSASASEEDHVSKNDSGLANRREGARRSSHGNNRQGSRGRFVNDSETSQYDSSFVKASAQTYPSKACLEKLCELGKLSKRQKAIMDLLEDIREQLAKKADKKDLERFLTQDDLQDLLSILQDLKEEIKGFNEWQKLVDDVKVPALRDVLNELEKQVADLLKKLADVMTDQQKQHDSIDALFASADRLEETKLDKDALPDSSNVHERCHQQERKESTEEKRTSSPEKIYLPPIDKRGVGIMGSVSSIDKDDETDFGLFATKPELSDAIDNLKRILKELLDRLDDHENDCRNKISGILDRLDAKLDREEMDPLKEYLESRYNALLEQQRDQDQKLNKHGKQSPSHDCRASSNRGKSSPPRVTPGYNGYVMDQAECSHPLYGDGGFIPQKKQAAAFKKQMKFNCLSCDRPLTLETNSHLQTIRGRPLNANELDQLRLLQKILKGDTKSSPTRACGGRHTSSTPNKRLTHRMNSSATSLPATSQLNADALLIDSEVDIEGLDGRLYRGLVSKKDLNHSRSKSANAQLRTVSPQPIHSSNGGKYSDYNTSYSSIDIPTQ